MPGQSDVRMPCGRPRYCGSSNCKHATVCRERERLRAEGAAQAARACAGQGPAGGTAHGSSGCGTPAGKKPLAYPADMAFLYDGSLPGLMCCVHECVYSRQLPAEIWPEGEAQPSLFEQRLVPTDQERAARVLESIPKKISPRAMELVQNVFLSCCKQKEMATLRFLLLGYQVGSQAPWMFGHSDVKPMLDAEKHQMGETHLLKGFIRFSDYDGVLAATISPKNFVLPYLVKHFTARYSEEDFIIFDKTHKAALIYENRQSRIVPLEGVEFPEADETEEQYRALWKRFYNTIAIQERVNHKCRRTMMPMRYWENMLEVSDLLQK